MLEDRSVMQRHRMCKWRHLLMFVTSQSAEKRYICLKIVNNKTKMNKKCVSSHRCLGSPVVRKKEYRLKGFISQGEINLSRQKQNNGFYLFDKSLYFPNKRVIYIFISPNPYIIWH